MISLGIDLFMVDTSSKKSSDSALKEWIARTEAIEVRKNLQYFKQSAGLSGQDPSRGWICNVSLSIGVS